MDGCLSFGPTPRSITIEAGDYWKAQLASCYTTSYGYEEGLPESNTYSRYLKVLDKAPPPPNSSKCLYLVYTQRINFMNRCSIILFSAPNVLAITVNTVVLFPKCLCRLRRCVVG